MKKINVTSRSSKNLVLARGLAAGDSLSVTIAGRRVSIKRGKYSGAVDVRMESRGAKGDDHARSSWACEFTFSILLAEQADVLCSMYLNGAGIEEIVAKFSQLYKEGAQQ